MPQTNYNHLYLASILNYIKDAVWLLDTNLRTLDINPAVYKLLGWQRGQVIGLSYQELLPTIHDSCHASLAQYLKQSISIVQEIPFPQGVTLSPGNGRCITIEGAAYPLTDQKQVVGVVAVFRPISPNRETERLQDNFITMASHNLRTPLMSIQASLDYVLEAQADEIKNKNLLENARVQSKRLATVLRELLNMSQLASGKEILIRFQLVALKPLVEMVAQNFRSLYPETALNLTVPSDLPLISTDRTKVEIILQNLLNHARRRNNMQDTIELAVDEKNENLLISIVDRGPFISPERYEQIFWHVYTLEPEKGAGTVPYAYTIGLFTTRQLVELLGGSIWISQAKPDGIGINFTLPIKNSAVILTDSIG